MFGLGTNGYPSHSFVMVSHQYLDQSVAIYNITSVLLVYCYRKIAQTNVNIGVYLTLVSSKKNMSFFFFFFFYCKDITTIKSICNACSYLLALNFVSYSTVSIGFSKEKYCRVLPLL